MVSATTPLLSSCKPQINEHTPQPPTATDRWQIKSIPLAVQAARASLLLFSVPAVITIVVGEVYLVKTYGTRDGNQEALNISGIVALAVDAAAIPAIFGIYKWVKNSYDAHHTERDCNKIRGMQSIADFKMSAEWLKDRGIISEENAKAIEAAMDKHAGAADKINKQKKKFGDIVYTNNILIQEKSGWEETLRQAEAEFASVLMSIKQDLPNPLGIVHEV